MSFKILEILPHLMRPAGGGIPSFSAGKGAALGLQSVLYKMLFPTLHPESSQELSIEQINSYWKETWSWLSHAKVVLIGVPLDTGAGIRRGAAYGPRGVREELFKLKGFQKLIQNKEVIDLGDIYVNPHLLYDEMLNEEQKQACRQEMYPDADSSLRSRLPVSALTQLKIMLEALTTTYPKLRIQIIGGDHSVAWPVTEVLAKKFPGTLGIVQPDAHTDLLASRLGIKYCFGTWSFHANNLLGRNGKMVQLGIRQTGKDKTHWETTTGVKQYWAAEILARPEDELIQEMIGHLKAKGVRQIYFSNDIDGTDESEASATGTPASGGLTPSFLLKVIQALGNSFEMIAGDVVEVAPDLGKDALSKKKTCSLAANYMLTCLEVQTHCTDS